MTSLWAQEAADQFWTLAEGAPPAFPRDLTRAVGNALPLAIVSLPRLRLHSMNQWLARHRLAPNARQLDRPLRGGLFVHQGRGFIFLEATDPDDERRFSLAHEAAHYLVEYALPLAHATARLGPQVEPLFAGERAPTIAERLSATLAGVDLPSGVHLLERQANGSVPSVLVSLAEQRADELALELLAPVETVVGRLPTWPTADAARARLRAEFGLPEEAAALYAQKLGLAERSPRSLTEDLQRYRVELSGAGGE